MQDFPGRIFQLGLREAENYLSLEFCLVCCVLNGRRLVSARSFGTRWQGLPSQVDGSGLGPCPAGVRGFKSGSSIPRRALPAFREKDLDGPPLGGLCVWDCLILLLLMGFGAWNGACFPGLGGVGNWANKARIMAGFQEGLGVLSRRTYSGRPWFGEAGGLEKNVSLEVSAGFS